MKFLSYEQLPAFLEHLSGQRQVIAPSKDDKGMVRFAPWAPGDDVELDVLLAQQSPKEFIFRQSETYLTYEYRMEGLAAAQEDEPGSEGGDSEEGSAEDGAEPAHEVLSVQVNNEAPPQVIFGLRPCDARGFSQMDQVFGGYGGFYFDPLYNAKREATTLLAVTCRDPRSTCFCTAIGGSPSGTEGVDVLFTQLENGFVVEPLTEKGEEALEFSGFADGSGDQEQEAAGVKEQAEERVDVPFEIEAVRDNLHDNFADDAWPDLAMRCISCGTCTYVCPNCYCFNITDEKMETRGERMRTWDNCFNPNYTRETSGHNPRDPKPNRFRNRFSHKFWYYPDKYDSLLCSGCGRCIMHCPTRIDLREVLRVMGSPRQVPAGKEES